MTRRERIINEIAVALKTILTANGYRTEAGDNVFIDRSNFDDVETTPFINLDESTDDIIEQSGTRQGQKFKLSLPIAVEGTNTCSPLEPSSKGHELIGDIKQCLFDRVWSTDIIEIRYQNSTIAQHESGSGIVSVSINAEVIYAETIGNPEE